MAFSTWIYCSSVSHVSPTDASYMSADNKMFSNDSINHTQHTALYCKQDSRMPSIYTWIDYLEYYYLKYLFGDFLSAEFWQNLFPKKICRLESILNYGSHSQQVWREMPGCNPNWRVVLANYLSMYVCTVDVQHKTICPFRLFYVLFSRKIIFTFQRHQPAKEITRHYNDKLFI